MFFCSYPEPLGTSYFKTDGNLLQAAFSGPFIPEASVGAVRWCFPTPCADFTGELITVHHHARLSVFSTRPGHPEGRNTACAFTSPLPPGTC